MFRREKFWEEEKEVSFLFYFNKKKKIAFYDKDLFAIYLLTLW